MLKEILIFTLTIFNLNLFLVHSFDYCSIDCNGYSHTMCIFLSGGGPSCGSFQRGLEQSEKKTILNLHNELRQKVATGKETRGAQPSSSNMMEVTWNEEAAEIAQRWADQCTTSGHDSCRRTISEAHVGQNVGWMEGSDYSGRLKSREDAISSFVKGWYDEVENFDGRVANFNPGGSDLGKIGHYSQLVWAETKEIGCGFVQWKTEMDFEYKLVCNYVPGGNLKNSEIYKIGEPCSDCPLDSKCSQKWPGLCEVIVLYKEEGENNDAIDWKDDDDDKTVNELDDVTNQNVNNISERGKSQALDKFKHVVRPLVFISLVIFL